MMGAVAVAFGGAIGSVARYGSFVWAARLFGTGYPYGTLFVNVVGSAVLGVLYGLFDRVWPVGHELRLFMTAGLLGGFTTFSAFSLDVVKLAEGGNPFTAVSYAMLSVLASVGALIFALLITRVVA